MSFGDTTQGSDIFVPYAVLAPLPPELQTCHSVTDSNPFPFSRTPLPTPSNHPLGVCFYESVWFDLVGRCL